MSPAPAPSVERQQRRPLHNPNRKPSIDVELVEDAVGMLDEVNFDELFATWATEDGADPKRGGRPPTVSPKAVLAVWFAMVVEGRTASIKNIHQVLSRSLPHTLLTRLETQPNASYHATLRALHRLGDLIDGFPAPRRRLDADQQDEVWAMRAKQAEHLEKKKARHATLQNLLTFVSAWSMPEGFQHWPDAYCMDATPVETRGRPGKNIDENTPSPRVELDAGWYNRSKNGGPVDDKNPIDPTKSKWSWEGTFLVGAPVEGARPGEPALPPRAFAMEMHRPGIMPGNQGRRVLEALVSFGAPPSVLAGDRAYWPNALPERLAIPARQLGFLNVNDYRIDELGHIGSYEGGMLVEGHYYCPSMPLDLVNASIDFRNGVITEETYRKRLERRAKYRLRPKEGRDHNGNEPLMCPAIGPGATARCPLRPKSMTAEKGTRVTIRKKPREPGKFCTQTSVTVPADHAHARYRQDFIFGSPEWEQAYYLARNSGEGYNAVVKDPMYEDAAEPKKRRVRGFTMQSIATIINVAAANVRMIRGFFEKWDEWLGKLEPEERSKVTGFMPKETNLAKLAKAARRAERHRRGPP